MTLLIRENNSFTVENEKTVGPNIISFELVTGRRRNERWYVVGCYLPPSDTEGETRRRTKAALEAQPPGTRLLLLGDLNADLDCPRTRQEEILATDLEEHGLRCVTEHFVTRRRRRCRGRWTWRRRNLGGRGGKGWHRSKPDYFMAQGADRKRFRRCRWVLPPTHNSDHRALVVKIALEGGD